VPAEWRLRLFHLIRDLTASNFGGYNLVVTLHGEGSLQTQLLTTYREYDLERPKALVRQILGLPHA
jgi:4-hydroxybutyryl-CoA dehydratase/vinylacetyl-CoA-Delta-isomerase